MPVVSAAAIAKVRAYTEGNMDGLVIILRGKAGVLDKATGKVGGMSDATKIYGGDTGKKARIKTVSGQGSLALGPGQIDVRQVVVSIPWSAPMPRRDDIVLVLSAGQDADLTGAALRVVEVEGGGLFGDARRCSCTTWGRSSQWDGVAP